MIVDGLSPTRRALALALAAVAVAYAVPFLFFPFVIGPFDFDHLSGYYELAWRFWRTSPGLPQYNPYLCGGRTLGGDPQLPIFHPLTLLVPVLGATVLVKLELLLQGVVGSWALWHCLGHLGADRPGRWWGVFLWISGGAVVAKYLVGHVTLGFFLLFPLFLYASYRLTEAPREASHRWRVLYWALFAYSGFYKPNFPIYGVPLLATEAAARSLFRRSPRPLVELIAAAAFGAAFDAVTLVPAWKYFRDFPRRDGSYPMFIAPYSLVANLLLPLKGIPKAFYGSDFLQRHEYSCFVGPVAVFFAWLGARATARRPEIAALLVLGTVSALLGIGAPAHEWSLYPYTWFRQLWPGFNSIRVPVRLWFGAYLAVIALSAIGFREPRTRRGLLALILLGILPLVGSAAANLAKVSAGERAVQGAVPRAYPPEIVAVHNASADQYRFLRSGQHVLDCTDNIEVNRAPDLTPGPLLPPGAAWERWNRIRVTGTGTVTLDLNHSPYWRWEGKGAIVSTAARRLAVESRGGIVDGTLVFTQPLVAESLAVTAAALFLLGAYGAWAFLRKRPVSGTMPLWRASSASV